MAEEIVLSVNDISKAYADRHAVKNITFSVAEGEILGFLGPNGAGKTTVLKIITGLLQPDAGQVTVCGHDLARERETALASMGAIIETPSFYGYLSGKANLRQLARVSQINDEQLNNCVKMLHLEDVIQEKTRSYSLGMKQRLGIARALLCNPRLLVLDEPTNGLDPAGIRFLRETLRSFASQGKSVLISSHILAEMESICDRIAIIENGSLACVKSTAELVDDAPEVPVSYRFETDNTPRATALLTEAGFEAYEENGAITVVTARSSAAEAVRLLNDSGINIYGVGRVRKTLEDAFIRLTEK